MVRDWLERTIIWQVVLVILAAVWILSAVALYLTYINAVRSAFTSALATFTSASATIILVGITYIYAHETQRIVKESRKDRRREAVIEMIAFGVIQLLSRLRGDKDSLKGRETPRDGSLPKPPSMATEDELLGITPAHILLDMETEISEFEAESFEVYSDKWEAYKNEWDELRELFGSEIRNIVDENIPQSKIESIREDFDHVIEEFESRQSARWVGYVSSTTQAKSCRDDPSDLLWDVETELAKKLLTLPVDLENPVPIIDKGGRTLSRKEYRLNFNKLFLLIQDELLEIRAEQQEAVSDLLATYTDAKRFQSSLITELESALDRLQSEYDIDRVHIQKKLDEADTDMDIERDPFDKLDM